MKQIAVSFLTGVVLAFSSAANAQTPDDEKWINQCIRDNKAEGATPEVVRKYCVCMNNKMDETETRSISQWEKANPAAMKACEREAGWK